MKRTDTRILSAGIAAIALGLATPAAAEPWGADIAEYDKAVAASAHAGDWLDGKLPVDTEVTYDGDPIAFRYATYIPEVAGYEKVMKKALNQLERESHGKIKVEGYYGQSLHPQAEAFTAVRDGIADWSACFMIYEPTSFDMLHSLTLPFLFKDANAATRTYMELYPKYFKEEYENMGVLMGRGMVTTPYNMIGNDKYETLADIKGSKVRVAGRVQIAALKNLGGVPVSIPSSEAYTSLQRGLVDTVSMNDPAFLIFKLQEISDYHNQVALFAVNLEYCASQDWVASLPADLQDVFADWAQKTNIAIAQTYYEREDRRAKKIFTDAGVELIQPSAAELAKWEEAVDPVTVEWVAEQEDAGRPGEQLLADIKSTLAGFEKQSWNETFDGIVAKPVKGYIDY